MAGPKKVKDQHHYILEAIMNTNEPIILTQNLFIAQGSHKQCYFHPQDNSRCIKVAYNPAGEKDLHREVRYLTHILKTRASQSGILPRYHGSVQTSKGQGFVFDVIYDFDGRISTSLSRLLNDPAFLDLHYHGLKYGLIGLRETLFKYNIISMAIYPENILCQKINPYDFKLMFINDMGSGAFIPLEYYWGPAAQAKIKRRWNRLARFIAKRHLLQKAQLLAQEIAC